MTATATPPLPSAPAWQKIGRPSPCEAQNWATWVSALGEGGGDALYRSLVLADGAIVVTVELHLRRGSGPRTVHRGRCGLPPDPEEAAERTRLLLGAADRAAARAVEAHRSEESAERVLDASRVGGRDGGVPSVPHELEDRIRERAHLPRERGCPGGRAADESREGARREAARAA